MKIRVVNGPNINMLGVREQDIYGKSAYSDLEDIIMKTANELNVECDIFQSNHEGDLIDLVQEYTKYDALIVNFGGYSHTSIALMDALLSIKSFGKIIIEVHISNVHSRENFRNNLISAKACDGVISGLGIYGYVAALEYIVKRGVV